MPSSAEDGSATTWLSWWLMFMFFLAAYNTVINYLFSDRSWNPTHQLYTKAQVTTLQCRTFATWTSITAAVRLQAAYQIHNQAAYGLALFTLAAASTHFALEWLVFKTMTRRDVLQSGFAIDLASTLWMAYGWLQHWYF